MIGLYRVPAAVGVPPSVAVESQMARIRSLYRRLAVLVMFAAGLSLAACNPTAAKPITVGITGYTFTSEGVQEYYVNGIRGSNLPPYGGGGSTSCCVSLPAKWTPDLNVNVNWTTGHWTVSMEKIQAMDISEAIRCCLARRTLSKVVPVERYGEEGGRLQVFFLANDEIRVWVSNIGLLSPDHPSHMSYPKKPDTAE
jgi:hypothetical protein